MPRHLPLCLLLLVAIFFNLMGCSQEAPPPTSAKKTTPPPPTIYNCKSCHSSQLDPKHNFSCTVCHLGQEGVKDKQQAHTGMLSRPAHPDHMAATCGKCHNDQVKNARQSLHFTSAHEVNLVRRAFGAQHDLAQADDIPISNQITTALELADDLLRRRCLRCHIRYDGDSYAETLRGTGCAACHLEFHQGTLVSHAIIKKTPDSQCLHCHNSNFVGADYYGRAEHDFHWDYRTPYSPEGGDAPRPYGVEYHQLSTDIHQQAGLHCLDCHPGQDLMSGHSRTTCQSCHAFDHSPITPGLQLHKDKKGQLILSLPDQKSLVVPQLRHPAHKKYSAKADCAVCHATWAFSDEGTFLFRQDDDTYEPWEAISVDGSFEVEQEVYRNINLDGDPFPFMFDKLTGQKKLGLWHKGFSLRRWEFPLICADQTGKLHICRPILDLHLSWVNDEEEVVMADIQPTHGPTHGLRPYTPHTIGKAGPFYRQRLRPNLHLLSQPLNMDKGPGLNPAMGTSNLTPTTKANTP